MKDTNTKALKECFQFLIASFDFKVKEVKSYDYALYARFVSNKVGIYFTYEFRDRAPQIQFTKLNGEDLKIRPGIYTIIDLYKNPAFKLQSFYLDEILLFKGESDYFDFFNDVTTVEEAIKLSSNLTEKYAKEFF